MKKIIHKLITVSIFPACLFVMLMSLKGCAYNEYNITGSNNKIDGTINAPKDFKTDLAGSMSGSNTAGGDK